MKIDLRELSDDQILAIRAASKEQKFSSSELLEEVVPLIKPYFISDFKLCKKSLKFIFPNGQQFTLYIKEDK